jgi:ferredoxin/flavodoxin---NADP+ reductase
MDEKSYNSTVIGKILITPDLMILRIRTDDPRKNFAPGQFTSLGLFGYEKRSLNSAYPIKDVDPNFLIKRPYSIASANQETQNFEFYINQVKSGILTPRLFNLNQGARLWTDTKISGLFNLSDTPKNNDIVMIASGTGIAPYISFLRSYIKDNQNIKILLLHGAAYLWDLGYYSELKFIDNTFQNFFYFPTLINPDESWNGLTGPVENHFKNNLISKKTGIKIDPQKTHFFLCGNPDMIDSLSLLLSKFDYTRHTKQKPGSLHIEVYK